MGIKSGNSYQKNQEVSRWDTNKRAHEKLRYFGTHRGLCQSEKHDSLMFLSLTTYLK